MNDRPIHHVCYIVDDIPTAVDQWVETTGAGPFFHLGQHVEFEETLLEGEPCVFDHASAIGKWGPIFLELIELHEVTPELESRFYTVVPVAARSPTSATSSTTLPPRASVYRPPGCPSSCTCARGRSRSRCTTRRCSATRWGGTRTPTRSTGCSRCSRLGLRAGMGA